jgi:hypothetical protein
MPVVWIGNGFFNDEKQEMNSNDKKYLKMKRNENT